jgi:hypothetical protein
MIDNGTIGDPQNDAPMTGQDNPASTAGASAPPAWQPTPEAMAKGLGWFSIALGLAELLAPDATARATGARHGKNLLQAYGAREIATGIGLLTAKDPQPWLWARVAGDALDLATLAADLGSGNDKRRNTAWSMLAVLGVTALDVYAAETARRAAAEQAKPVRDYSDRVGMALSPEEMRGKAREVLQQVPQDMQTPTALRPYTLH